MRSSARIVLIVLILAVSAAVACATQYQVRADGTGDFRIIQDAIDASKDGDTIVVHPGTYPGYIEFNGENIVVRSTEPDNPDTVASTIIDGENMGSVVTFSGTENETCELSGLTITNGYSHGVGGICGGPGEGSCTKARITNCTIEKNTRDGMSMCNGPITGCRIIDNAGSGLVSCNGPITGCTIADNRGGLYGCGGTIGNCTITRNSNYSPYSYCGALAKCNGPIINCTITHNSCQCIGVLWECQGNITNCTITDNSGEGAGGLCWCHGLISGCTISRNSCNWGGAGFNSCGGTITNCVVTENLNKGYSGALPPGGNGGAFYRCHGTITNCFIAKNSAKKGAGLFKCKASLRNCTITGNTARKKGGGLYKCKGDVTDCIIWANQAKSKTNRKAQVHGGSTPSYCCIQGWERKSEGNTAADPLFVEGPNGGYYLDPRSSCIDAGSQSAAKAGLDKRTTLVAGAPDKGTVDMGFHYFIPPVQDAATQRSSPNDQPTGGDKSD